LLISASALYSSNGSYYYEAYIKKKHNSNFKVTVYMSLIINLGQIPY